MKFLVVFPSSSSSKFKIFLRTIMYEDYSDTSIKRVYLVFDAGIESFKVKDGTISKWSNRIFYYCIEKKKSATVRKNKKFKTK